MAHRHKNDTKPWNMLHSLSSLDSPRVTGRGRSHRSSIVEQQIQNLEDSEYFFGQYKKKLRDGTTRTYKLSDILQDYANASDAISSDQKHIKDKAESLRISRNKLNQSVNLNSTFKDSFSLEKIKEPVLKSNFLLDSQRTNYESRNQGQNIENIIKSKKIGKYESCHSLIGNENKE